MKKLRVSWTVLSNWASGKHQEALTMLNGYDMVPTDAMIRGREAHARVAKEKSLLNSEFRPDSVFEDTSSIDKLEWKNRFVVPIEEWLDLSGVVDIFVPSTKTIIDLKTGSKKSYEHDPMQLYIYAYALKKMGFEIERGLIQHINNSGTKGLDYTVHKITEGKVEKARDYILTIGSEIYAYMHT